ncbi:MAG: hypothetical protein IT186_06300 [Acidobacteria bacterium]|nr:hypothetical protein [Acidobacteriota bacterium]MCG3192422.1 hypothetical protein [Thermoanaerobaculia bacterium]MCK6683447.1 hypothetical protein [Thermoanaerobaculia bacterium]
MVRLRRVGLVVVAVSGFSQVMLGAPPLKEANISVARPDIKIWNVKATSDVREGSTTSTEQGKLNVTHTDGTTTSHDAKFKVQSGTLFQDGEICHNYGPKCYCGTTTFRFESGASKWKFGTPSNNKPVDCPSGIKPTGDAEIKKSMTKEELEAKKQQILKERAAKNKTQ